MWVGAWVGAWEVGVSPGALGMHSGFLADFYFVPYDISEVPNDFIATAAPNYEDVENTIFYQSNEDFKKVVGSSMPDQNFGVVWAGMLHVDAAGDYTFFVQSKDGAHLWVDGTKVRYCSLCNLRVLSLCPALTARESSKTLNHAYVNQARFQGLSESHRKCHFWRFQRVLPSTMAPAYIYIVLLEG